MNTISVCVVEDIPEIRSGLATIIESAPDFVLLAAWATAEEAVAQLPLLQPDVVLMDINLPGISGIEALRHIKPECPRTQFAMFTIYENNEQIFDALAAGASGYLLKSTPPPKILDGLRELHAGGSPMSAHIARKVVAHFQAPPAAPAASPTEGHGLSTREREVVEGLAKGLLYKEIAGQLGISVGTVRQHIHNIYEKLHVQNRTEALNKVYGR